ncbi:MAG: hypothetical protein J7L55_03665 [Desulfurococcales archaeon]|nr:hypothetical protein [Desulfurococcales archaeon]
MEGAEKLISVCLPRRGVSPSFRPCHVLKALKFLLESGPAGRPSLMRVLGLGEASTKTLLRRLKEADLVHSVKPEGTVLTEEGAALIKSLAPRLVVVGRVPSSGLCEGCVAWAVSLRNGAELIESYGGVVRVRDLLVREGALGGLILVKSSGRLYLPSNEGVEPFKGFKAGEEILRREDVVDGDAVMVALCRPGVDCECLTINSALELLRDLDC